LRDHFALLEDDRESWRVAHPLPEVPLLLVCGTIGACDDFDGIVEWREDNLPFLRRFLSHHHGVPGSRWLRILLNRIDPALSSEMFRSRAATLRPQAPALVAIGVLAWEARLSPARPQTSMASFFMATRVVKATK
jgi:hypothetical protein